MFMASIKIIYIERYLLIQVSIGPEHLDHNQKGLPIPIARRGEDLSSGTFSAPPISPKMLPISLSRRELLSFLSRNMDLHVNELTAYVLLSFVA